MLHEINLCCPDCGSYKWHFMPNLKSSEHCCDECGSVHTADEMAPQLFEYND